jgi:DUF4097 and DUF4098 domain-containing protein YvlB
MPITTFRDVQCHEKSKMEVKEKQNTISLSHMYTTRPSKLANNQRISENIFIDTEQGKFSCKDFGICNKYRLFEE